MSAWDENQLAQNAAIRRALGLPDDVEVTREANGWRVEVPEQHGRLAIELHARHGAERARTIDTFIAESDGVRVIDEGVLVAHGDRVLAGDASDRERYVTERAEQLARAYTEARRLLPIFRDLIDKGVLK